MPDNAELYNLFKGLLDHPPATGTEEVTVAEITLNIPPKFENKLNTMPVSTRARSKPEEPLLKGEDVASKRNHQAMPPDAVDVAGKPKKKVKIPGLHKQEEVERGKEHDQGRGKATTRSVTKKGEMLLRDNYESMDIDHMGDDQQGGGPLKDNYARSDICKDTGQLDGTNDYSYNAQEIRNGKNVPHGSRINQVLLNPLKHDTKASNEDMDTIEESTESDSNDCNASNRSTSHKLGKTINPMPDGGTGHTNQPERNRQEDKEMMDLIDEAVESGANDSAHPEAQKSGNETIAKPSIKQVLQSEHELNADGDSENGVQAIPQNTIRRPKYETPPPVIEGWVSWWSNALGKGQILERDTNEVRTIHWWQLKPHYGALHTGVSVEYQWEHERFQKFWVVQGMPYVTYNDAFHDLEEYPYMKAEHRGRG